MASTTPPPDRGITRQPSSGEGEGDTYEEMDEAARSGGLFGRVNQKFHDVLQSSRGTHRMRSPVEEVGEDPAVTADDIAIRRARSVKPQRMVVPEGVIIEGSMTSGSETEIAGRIEGNVNVEGRLYLHASALVSGNVRATACKVDGLVEGKMECSEELELGPNGRLNAEAVAGKRIQLAGHIAGNVTSGGLVHLVATCNLEGDIRARRIAIEEGAKFNGRCMMRAPSQQAEQKTP